MINEATIRKLAERAGIDPSVLSKAIKAEGEQSIEFDADGAFMAQSEIEAIEERGQKKGYKEGVKAGEEMLIKEIRNEEGLEFEGKTRDNLLKAMKEKILKDAKVEPERKVQELQDDNQKLRKLLSEKEDEFTRSKAEIENRINSLQIESLVKMNLPERLDNGLTREDLFTLYSSRRKFNRTETGIEIVDVKTNQPIKDKKLQHVTIENDLKDFLSSYTPAADPGRGGGDNVPAAKTGVESMKRRTEVFEYFEKNNIPLHEQAAILAKAAKNEGFDMKA